MTLPIYMHDITHRTLTLHNLISHNNGSAVYIEGCLCSICTSHVPLYIYITSESALCLHTKHWSHVQLFLVWSCKVTVGTQQKVSTPHHIIYSMGGILIVGNLLWLCIHKGCDIKGRFFARYHYILVYCKCPKFNSSFPPWQQKSVYIHNA